MTGTATVEDLPASLRGCLRRACWPGPGPIRNAAVTSGAMTERAPTRYGVSVMSVHGAAISVHDRDIVIAIVAGDAAALTAAYDRYAQDLYAYSRSRLPEPADAVDAVQDTFVVTSASVYRLTHPDRLRAWLFAVARNECQFRLSAAASSAQLYEAIQANDDTEIFAPVTEDTESRVLTHAALAMLDPADQEVAELSLRHDFRGADLGDILGMTGNQAQALAARARSRFEKSLEALPVVVPELEHCPELGAVLAGRGGERARLLRRRVKRHIRCCEICVEPRRIHRPAVLPGLLPAALAPGYLRQRTLNAVTDRSQSAVAYRADVIKRAPRFGANGFPIQLTSSTGPGWRGISVTAVAGAAAALALLGSGMSYIDHSFSQGSASAAAGRQSPTAGPTGSVSSMPALAGRSSAAPPRSSPVSAFSLYAPGTNAVVPALFTTLPPATVAPDRSASPGSATSSPSASSSSASASASPSSSSSPSPSSSSPSPSPSSSSPSPTPTSAAPSSSAPSPTAPTATSSG